jgi:hypothetical protein
MRYAFWSLIALLAACGGGGPAITITIDPLTATTKVNQVQLLNASVSGAANTSVTWSVTPADAVLEATTPGSNKVEFKAAQTGTYTVTATSNADAKKTASAQITVGPGIGVSISPANFSLRQNGSIRVDATVANSPDAKVTWSIEPETGIEVVVNANQTGANITFYEPGNYTVTATSQADPSAQASIQGVVAPSVVVALDANNPTIKVGQQQIVNATVQNAANTGVTWDIIPQATLTTAGNRTTFAPTAPGTYLLTATSTEDPTKAATTEITVTQVTLNLNPAQADISTNGIQTFTAVVAGNANTAADFTMSPSSGAVLLNSTDTTAQYRFDSPGTYTLTATSRADGDVSATSSITVASGIQVAVSPSSTAINVNQAQTFTANVTGTGNPAVAYSVSPNTGFTSANPTPTSIDYTFTDPGVYTVTATSAADNTKVDNATVIVSALPVRVTLSPSQAAISTVGVQPITATLLNLTNPALNWAVRPEAGTTLEVSGTQAAFAAAAPGTYVVSATSVSNPTKVGFSRIVVTSQVQVALAPQTASLQTGDSLNLTASVTSARDDSVKWTVNPSDEVVLSPNGNTATFSATRARTYTVTAVSTENPSRSATSTITVQPAISVKITPAASLSSPLRLMAMGKYTFSAAVQNATNPGVAWRVIGDKRGYKLTTSPTSLTIDFASTPLGSLAITAISLEDGRRGDTVYINLVPINPSQSGVSAGESFAYALRQGSSGTSLLKPWGYIAPFVSADFTFSGPIVATATGKNHMLLLRPDGTLITMGANDQGQRGIGTTAPAPAFFSLLSTPKDIVQIAAGNGTSMALDKNNNLWIWGGGWRSSPTKFWIAPNIKQLAATSDRMLFLQGDTLKQVYSLDSGIVKEIAWNILRVSAHASSSTALIMGDEITTATVSMIKGDNSIQDTALTNVAMIARGGNHNLALKTDGTLWSWGTNNKGQLGYTGGGDNQPRQVIDGANQPLTGVVSIAAGADFSLAVLSDRRVATWGNNDQGQLGGAPDNLPHPVYGFAPGITDALFPWEITP